MGWNTSRARARALLTASAIWVTVPAASLAENLADALVGAYNTAGLLEQNRAVLRAADEGVAQSVSALRPVIDYAASLTRSLSSTTTNGFVTDRNATELAVSAAMEWLIWDNGSSKYSIQAAQENVLATRAGLLSVEQEILQRAVVAYMSVISQRESVRLRQSNVRLLTQELRAAQDRFEVGEVTRTDVALAESSLAEARANVATAQGDLIEAEEEYLAAVGRRPGALAPPPRLPARPASINAGKAIAMRQHPEIIQAQHQAAAVDLTVLATRASFGPRVTFDAAVSQSESRNNASESDANEIGLNVTQRIYQGGALASNLRDVIADRDAARANIMIVQENVAQDVATALVRFEAAQASIVSTRERIRFAEIAFEGVREEATLGARTTLDVLDAEQDLLDAQVALIAAEADLQIAAYQILSAQGLLTAEKLGLGVQIYDPTVYYNQVKDAPAFRSRQGQQLDRVLRGLGKD